MRWLLIEFHPQTFYPVSRWRSSVKRAISFIQKVLSEWNQDKVTRLAAALSYYTIFSLAPLLVIIIAVAGLFLGADIAQEQIIAQMQALVGAEGAGLMNDLLTNARNINTNLIAALVGIVTILLGATGVVGELKDALNTIWNVAPKPDRGLFATFFERVLSFGMILGIGFILLVSLVVSASLAALNMALRGYFEQWVVLAQGIDLLLSVGSITLLFALLFKFLPDVQVAWRDVWIGAFITALLFTLGKYALGLYVGNSNVASPFGAAGALVILLVWIYYSAQIFFLGAEITQVYANEFGSGVRPNENALPLTDAARVAQGTRTPEPIEKKPMEPVPQPLYMELPRRRVKIAGPFNPLRLIGGALGVRFFGSLAEIFAWGNNLVRRIS